MYGNAVTDFSITAAQALFEIHIAQPYEGDLGPRLCSARISFEDGRSEHVSNVCISEAIGKYRHS